MKEYTIVELKKEEWEMVPIPMRYTTNEYYDVQKIKEADGLIIRLVKRPFDEPVTHGPEEYDFPDKLFEPHWENAKAWGIVEETGGKKELKACIEICPEEWSNRMLVTELWVHEDYRHRRIAHKLMSIAINQAKEQKRRALILETQSCNVPAISFYLREGFELVGFDTCCYRNNDIERKEVRFNLGMFFSYEQ